MRNVSFSEIVNLTILKKYNTYYQVRKWASKYLGICWSFPPQLHEKKKEFSFFKKFFPREESFAREFFSPFILTTHFSNGIPADSINTYHQGKKFIFYVTQSHTHPGPMDVVLPYCPTSIVRTRCPLPPGWSNWDQGERIPPNQSGLRSKS